MADAVMGNGADALEETLGRLNKKAGVKATIVLDRTSGAILKTSGQILSVRASRGDGSSSVAGLTEGQTETQAVEELAGMVWNFVNAAGGLVQDLDAEDELKLLRLRTKRQELVIVPDPKYLLIVVHDTPPA
ncbi:hypothetical protein DL546_002349 [Coniochaeta pulveracea]|uniref:Roadblock/LAMTOR2 domain-containing protein n=1 Tax=Coniochaeta pulveracea TaxID=177199 RepID=A0A420XY15_9PEZI|nr:hypothetical protein DL546_002349 [Coniochaeta pulveracea]